jgi:hypothetical protein
MTAATIAATVTTTVTTATAAIAAEVTATTATAAIFAWLGFIDFQSATTEFLTIELVDGCQSLGVGRHLDEREASGPPRFAIFDYAC